MPDLAAWAPLFGPALLSTAAAYVLFFRLLARAGATNLTRVTFLVPISALLFGHTLLAEPIRVRAVAGRALIATGPVTIDGRLCGRLRPATS